ncbi:hypothetical protein [Vibrio barjaei]|uniref:hypothetical protein n=1 Tax=Vibrio barjaei TaxID=1676683 RepID=UPI0022837D0C|nr:hypothetical protein [Vibrio barjaei]MCY9874009.1 hypothetical protein [Vibrio barjaei]
MAVYIDCTRCAGDKKLFQFSNVKGGVCFKCKGTGKQRKTKRVRVQDNWFLIENSTLNHSSTKSTLKEATDTAQELDAMLFDGEEKTTITPRSGYHYEHVPV